jgi:hypothetical protein
LGRVTKLLQEAIDDISNGFEEPTKQGKIIPEREAESLERLLDSWRQSCHGRPHDPDCYRAKLAWFRIAVAPLTIQIRQAR